MLSDEVRKLEELHEALLSLASEMHATFMVNWQRGNYVTINDTAAKNWDEILDKWGIRLAAVREGRDG